MEKVEKKGRRAFTKGWDESLEITDSLPIKRGDKVIQTYVPTPKGLKNQEEIIHDDEDEIQAESQDKAKVDPSQQVKKIQVKKENLEINIAIETSDIDKIKVQQKVADICTHILANPEEAFSHRKKSAKKITDGDDDASDSEEEERPQKKKKGNEEEEYHIEDLLALSLSKNAYEIEIALLSTAVLFKDICPSYRIRHVNTEADNSQLAQNANKQGNPMKKETKKLMQYEKLLVKYYHDYLLMLQRRVDWAFQVNHSIPDSLNDLKSQKKYEKIRIYLGFIAFKCQCELVKSLYAFNYRSLLLTSILSHAMTLFDYHSKTHSNRNSFPLEYLLSIIQEIIDLTVESLQYLIQHDKEKDCILDMVITFNRFLKNIKYNISISLLKVFHSLTFHIHMDEKEKIGKQKKMNKRQLKQKINTINQEITVGLLESNANGNEINKKSFEIQILQEICFIYFRILKLKIGYHLLPVALEGLSKITHLINMDTIQDLISILKSFLFQEQDDAINISANNSSNHPHSIFNPHTPYEVKLLSLHCVLKTLSSNSGKEILQVDDEPYLLMFKQLLKDFPFPTPSPPPPPSTSSKKDAEEGEESVEKHNKNNSNNNNNSKVTSLKSATTFSMQYYWKIIYEIIDCLFIAKYHDSIHYQNYLITIIRFLLINICIQVNNYDYLPNNNEFCISLLTFIHNILMKYPRIRQSISNLNVFHTGKVNEKLLKGLKKGGPIYDTLHFTHDNQNYNYNENDDDEVMEVEEGEEEGGGGEDQANKKKKKKKKKKSTNSEPQLFVEDDKVEDFAMKGLQDLSFIQPGSSSSSAAQVKQWLSHQEESNEDSLKDVLFVLAKHPNDRRYHEIIEKMLSKDFLPLPFHWSELDDNPSKQVTNNTTNTNNINNNNNKNNSSSQQGPPRKNPKKRKFDAHAESPAGNNNKKARSENDYRKRPHRHGAGGGGQGGGGSFNNKSKGGNNSRSGGGHRSGGKSIGKPMTKRSHGGGNNKNHGGGKRSFKK